MSKEKKYSRREALKYGAKVGAWALISGGIGNLFGRGYNEGKDIYKSDVKPYVEKGKKIIDESESVQNKVSDVAKETRDFWSEYIPQLKRKEKEVSVSQPKKTTRRGFFKDLVYKALSNTHENPIRNLTLIGAGTGTGIGGLYHLQEYLNKKEIAKLKDKNTGYEKRLEILEGYKEKLEKEVLSQKGDVEKLKEDLNKVTEILKNSSGGLEEKLKGSRNKPLIVIGFIGVIASIFVSSFNLTGFAIFNENIKSNYFLGAGLFFISLLTIFLGKK